MTANLVPQPPLPKSGSSLRELLKQYLQLEKTPEKLSWESLTTHNGLPHNWIYDIFQDSHERIWVGTWGGGLACLDSGKWRIFTKLQGLFSDEVTCIREDKTGGIWVATDNGLNLIRDGKVQPAGLSGKSLLNMTFDPRGNLWVGCWRAALSGGGLFRFDGRQWESYTTRQDLPGLEILKVFFDTSGRLWVGTYEQGYGAGVGCYDGTRWQNYREKDGLINDCVYSMFEDPSGNIWFGTVGGLSIYDGKTWHNLTRKDGLVDDRVFCMVIDSHKKMWFGTEGGVSRFDGETWTSYTSRDGLVDNLVRTVIETKDGRLWFGTYPYAQTAGGISIATYQTGMASSDHLLDLLPQPPHVPKLPPR